MKGRSVYPRILHCKKTKNVDAKRKFKGEMWLSSAVLPHYKWMAHKYRTFNVAVYLQFLEKRKLYYS
jgi:hypothetical protein